ncbi:MAG TPA: cytochrome c [Thiobacillaceae bacterium]|nr:cytochrome c [Thiobacillaceae bacterium]HNU64113.1 cytochrome c [Thiobacillaceae bacterium]
MENVGCARLAALCGLLLSLALTPARADSAVPDSARQKELTHFVRQECGFCHGLRLTGGLGSALTAEAMRDRPFEAMVDTILHGRGGTAMPGWASFLTEDEARWIVQRLQEGFPNE